MANTRTRNTFGQVSNANHLGRLQPQAIELEESILGALMIDKEAINLVVDMLVPDAFYKPAHQVIYQAIFDLFANAEPIDMLSVTQQLRKTGKLEFVGNASVIARLTSNVQSSAHIQAHAQIVLENYLKRQLISVASEIQTNAFEDNIDVFEQLDNAQQKLFDISEQNIRKSYTKISNLLEKTLQEIEARRRLKDGLTGVPTGFIQLDRLTNGWQKSDLIIIAARPSVGKTAFALSIARNAAVDFKRPVAFFSLEMPELQITERLLIAETEIESYKIKKGQLSEQEMQIIKAKSSILNNAPIYIDDTPSISILELRAKCRRLKAQHNVQLILIDYLQLIRADNIRNVGNREQEIAYISRSLKAIAKELQVPVIALSQLSRDVEKRGGDRRPQLSDLRESGSIEQDADIVIFLYRPECHGITQDMEGNSTQGYVELVVAKHRNGALDNIPLQYVAKYLKYVETPSENTFTKHTSQEFNNRANELESRVNTLRPSQRFNQEDEPPF
ncbi:MAG: replicative DNA helicase [Microscillaceae bacterium]|nr:replicative DNA helicase [Microscillaceae bacterium]MDW8460860.1 replicative DNA helicase [Cytophagales bacterium]